MCGKRRAAPRSQFVSTHVLPTSPAGSGPALSSTPSVPTLRKKENMRKRRQRSIWKGSLDRHDTTPYKHRAQTIYFITLLTRAHDSIFYEACIIHILRRSAELTLARIMHIQGFATVSQVGGTSDKRNLFHKNACSSVKFVIGSSCHIRTLF